ncbi:hypothetical protein BGY98DRAFT_1045176 [Russula aff. rugulosa BPL654]|nr:hypothetical protein BGY98DRAFT_1045176 [Russula aff. rugulosa BPL654]
MEHRERWRSGSHPPASSVRHAYWTTLRCCGIACRRVSEMTCRARGGIGLSLR